MSEKMKNTGETKETGKFVAELDEWKERQKVAERQGDTEVVVNSIIRQVEYLYHLDRVDEARAFLDDLPDLVDLNLPQVREMIADAYIMIDDVDYFYYWYKQNLLQREANEGDQILIYGLLCHNRNNDALEVFNKTFSTLESADHFKYALRHIPKLIINKTQREFYYQTILEKSKLAIGDQAKQSDLNAWFQTLLQTQYCLKDLSGFEETVHSMAQIDQTVVQPHVDFLERLLDLDNQRWKENKVFGIGLSKTGTSSLSKALSLLNFSTAHWTNPYSHDLLAIEDVPLFDSLTDISISHQYEEIYEKYPDAKFVLTTRPIEKWKKSFLSHYARSMHAASFEDLRSIVTDQYPPRFGQRYVDMHRDLYFQYSDLEEAYLSHEAGVHRFFKGKEDQLLTIDVSQPNALQDLARFLSVDAPQSNFPHENTKEEKSSWVSPLSGVTRRFQFKN